jgi:formylglycine-generating enzyme required for sulfatase activity
MKPLYLALAAMALLCLSFAKIKPFVPAGTVQINDTLFADEVEVSNFAWQEYEYWTKSFYGSNSKEHIATLPDTLIWREKLSYGEPYVAYYYRHPAYRDYPVVGITYEQAVAYCAWRTERVKTYLSVKKDFKNRDFNYRLPTKAEWEKLANTSTEFLKNDGKNSKGQRLLNCVNNDTTHIKNPANTNNDVTAPVYSYWPNSLKLYNMVGNVAEMVMEKGICKGGAWRQRLEECRPGKDLEYTNPTAWIGFRCVCIVKNS